MKIRNWDEFQHFKDRTPPWIKLYRYILDDPDWHALDGNDAKTLVMLWLMASEDKAMLGSLPPLKNMAFRLRVSENELNQTLNRLSSWLLQDDNNVISICHQTDAPEERRDRGETERVMQEFETFYSAYPKKKNRGDAEKAWKRIKPDLQLLMNSLEWQKKQPDWIKDKGKFIPYPASWLNAKGWLDEEFNQEEETPSWKKGML